MLVTVKVPGSFNESTMLDLETVKLAVPGDFRMANGEPLRRRWSVSMAGVARRGNIALVFGADEELMLKELGELLRESTAVVYGATREFDEMICRGRFTNARRAHLAAPTFPAVPGAETLPWRNIKTAGSGARRGADVPSCDVPEAIRKGQIEVVLVHLLRDVADLILTAGEPDDQAARWCRMVLASYAFAASVLAKVGV